MENSDYCQFQSIGSNFAIPEDIDLFEIWGDGSEFGVTMGGIMNSAFREAACRFATKVAYQVASNAYDTGHSEGFGEGFSRGVIKRSNTSK